MTILDLVSVDHAMPWRPWAVFYFLLIGAAVGAALVAAATRRTRGAEAADGPLAAAAALALAAPLPLLADLHQPARFLNFYLSFATDSIMWWGSWLLPLFVGATAALAAGRALGLARRAGGLLWVAVVALGLAVLAYTAAEMTIVAARPLWHNAFFPTLLTLTALTAGAGAALAVDAGRGATPAAGRGVLAVAAPAALVTFGLWLLADPRLATVALERQPAALLAGFALAGLALPAVLARLARARLAAVVAGAAAFTGAFLFRWAVFTEAQLMAKTERDFFATASLLDPEVVRAGVGSAAALVLAGLAVHLLFQLRGGLAAPRHV